MDIPKSINIAELARKMGKTRQWVYQRINGSLVNGKPVKFKKTELDGLCDVLEVVKKDVEATINNIRKQSY